jgi:predicted GNAT family acetyltransferase
MDIYSTNVPGSLEGRGLGKLLADEAFQLAKERGLTIRPTCWYIAGYLRRQEDRSS